MLQQAKTLIEILKFFDAGTLVHINLVALVLFLVFEFEQQDSIKRYYLGVWNSTDWPCVPVGLISTENKFEQALTFPWRRKVCRNRRQAMDAHEF